MRTCLAAVVASLLWCAVPAHAARLDVGYAEALPGDEVTIAVEFAGQGVPVAATQNDIGFDSSAPIAARPDLTPDCSVNPAIDKQQSAFAFLPPGCTVGETCSGVRAVIISFSNVDPIPDGMLYTCRVVLEAESPPAPHALPCSAARGSTPRGADFHLPCRGGEVVPPGMLPTPTRSLTPPPTRTMMPVGTVPTRTPTRTPPPTVAIEISHFTAQPGDEVMIDVRLRARGLEVAATHNDIRFNPPVRIAANASGRPDCQVNPAINKPATAFAFNFPRGCRPEMDCSSISALVLAFDNVDPIPDGSVLYSCRVKVGDAGRQAYSLLDCRDASSSDPGGEPLVTECVDGHDSRQDAPTATATVSSRRTPTPVLPGGVGVGSPTPTRGNDDDGCAVGAPRAAAWMLLLIPALLWVRIRWP